MTRNEQVQSSFSFILTPFDLEPEQPFELVAGHWLRKANAFEIDLIKPRLSQHIGPFPGVAPQYEFDWRQEVDTETGSTAWNDYPLDAQLWRYRVVTMSDGPDETSLIDLAASLLPHSFELGFSFLRMNGSDHFGCRSHPLMLSSFFLDLQLCRTNSVPKISSTELAEVAKNYHALKVASVNHLPIFKAINRFRDLRCLPRQSEMLVIGYFAIIESIIAHKPRLAESLDSINHQLRSKLVLLSKRFERPIDLQQRFAGLAADPLWKQLYGYRSAIAHESNASPDSKYPALKGRDNVLSFLNEVVKLLILLGLKDPVLLEDLKNC